MARKARVKSSTGIYHVLIRAIANLPLFTDQEDYTIYTGILNDLQHEGRCEIYAHALFPTHVHLLIKEGTSKPHRSAQRDALIAKRRENLKTSEPVEPIGSIMKRLASAYSYFYNVKYDHYGPIYMDRFKSNPVETKDYFLKVLDHIDSQQTDHKYTCHHIPSGLVSSPREGQEGAPLLDFKERAKRITDSRLLAFLQDNYSFTNIGEFLQRESDEQKEVISNCKKIGGSIRQIVKLTGCPYQYVFSVRT